MTPTIAVVLKGYPRLSETFIAEEIFGLEQAGFRLQLIALRRPTDDRVHPVHRAIAAPVAYLPEYLHQAPLRVLAAWWRVRRRPGMAALWRQFLRDLPRDASRNRVRRLGQAFVLAADLPPEVTHLHAHFVHTPASVTRYAALLLGLPWSCSAHAKDIWTSPDWDLREKLAAARWTVTCTRTGRDRLAALSPGKSVRLVYHGLRLDRFLPLTVPRPPRDGSRSEEPVRLLSVGRAVEKKGFDVLIAALALLPDGCHWHWTHIGGGALLADLKRRVAAAGLDHRVAFLGAQDQTAVLEHYRRSDLFVLPCRVAGDGDRDGLPNVLVEAQSQGLACVSTDVGGVAELIDPGRNGVLVPPDDPQNLAAAMATLIGDPAARERLGRAGARRVATSFDARSAIASLTALFTGAPLPAEATTPEPVSP